MGSAYVAWVRRRHRAILVTAVAAVAVSGVFASRLELRTGLSELLPTGDPRVEALEEVQRRMGQLSSLVIVVRSPDAAANLAYAQALARDIDTREPALIERAVWGAPEVREFFSRNKWLYASISDLDGLEQRLRQEILRVKNPLFVPLDEPPSLDELQKRAESRSGLLDRLPNGVFATPSGELVALVLVPSRSTSSDADGAIERFARRAIAARPHPGLRVSLAGDVHSSVEERRAIEGDVALTSGIVSVLVAVAVALYFGRLRAIPLMALPALTGLMVAMGVAGIAFGGLNASTVFLGAIIVGNGINYPILTLARYAEERDRGRDAARALEIAVVATARATSLAAFAASAAYGSLALTRFRGFSQFGVIGAVGMALCWIATMTVLPAALWLLDGNRPGRVEKIRKANFGAPFARAAERAPWLLLAGGAAFTAAIAVGLPRWLADPFEYDLAKLRTTRATRAEQSQLDPVFGRALSPSVILAASREEARDAAVELRTRAAADPSPTIAHVVTVDYLLPGPVEEQREKLQRLRHIRALFDDPSFALLDDEQRARIENWRPPAGLRPIDADDLPELARRPFVEKDGTLGRVVLVFPPQKGFSLSNGHDLIRLARLIRDVGGNRHLEATGRALIFAAMIESIAHDGPLATAASFAAVALLTVLLLRRKAGAAAVLATLALGMLWMIGVAALIGVKINFLNFVALPITFGIGVDYGANLYLRYRMEGRGSIGRALRSTGGAVALNSATTIIGYGSLLIAHNQALVSFGALAILGELACLSAALLILPAALAIRDRRR